MGQKLKLSRVQHDDFHQQDDSFPVWLQTHWTQNTWKDRMLFLFRVIDWTIQCHRPDQTMQFRWQQRRLYVIAFEALSFIFISGIDRWYFRSVFQCVTQAGLEIAILSPQSLRCWGYKQVTPSLSLWRILQSEVGKVIRETKE